MGFKSSLVVLTVVSVFIFGCSPANREVTPAAEKTKTPANEPGTSDGSKTDQTQQQEGQINVVLKSCTSEAMKLSETDMDGAAVAATKCEALIAKDDNSMGSGQVGVTLILLQEKIGDPFKKYLTTDVMDKEGGLANALMGLVFQNKDNVKKILKYSDQTKTASNAALSNIIAIANIISANGIMAPTSALSVKSNLETILAKNDPDLFKGIAGSLFAARDIACTSAKDSALCKKLTDATKDTTLDNPAKVVESLKAYVAAGN
jgi:hypothetical protein